MSQLAKGWGSPASGILPALCEHCCVRPGLGELETADQKTRAEIATYIRDPTDQVDDDGDVALDLGGTTVQLNPTGPVTFKSEGGSEWSQRDSEAKQSSECAIVWCPDASTTQEGTLDVQERFIVCFPSVRCRRVR